MKRMFLTILGVVTLVCMIPSIGKADPVLMPMMMELQGAVESVNLNNHTIVISGTTFRLATDRVLHGITVDGQDQTVLKAGDMVGYQVDKNNARLIRKIVIMPHR